MKYDRSSRARRKAISDAAVWVCVYARAPPCLTLLRFDSHSAIRYPPVDAPTIAPTFLDDTHLPTRTFFSFHLVYFGFTQRNWYAFSLISNVFQQFFKQHSIYFRKYCWSKMEYIKMCVKKIQIVYIYRFISYKFQREKKRDGLAWLLYLKKSL